MVIKNKTICNMFMIILLFSCFNSHFDPETIKLSKKKKEIF